MDTQRLRELLDQRDAIDEEIAQMASTLNVRAAAKPRKAQTCSLCGSDEHTARNCPTKSPPAPLS